MDRARFNVHRATRRTALGFFGVGAVGFALAEMVGADTPALPTRPAARTGNNPLVAENRLAGARWRPSGAKEVDDLRRQVQGYASKTSAGHGEVVDFHVSVADGGEFDAEIHRVGHYGGAGGRLMARGPGLAAEEHAPPSPEPDAGRVVCAWPVSWSVTIPAAWPSGLYVASFTDREGHRAHTPFVVREPSRSSDILVIVPVTTYQAYNMWPADETNGRNLYKGYTPEGVTDGALRAMEVSFDRPYTGVGLPSWFEMETSFASWAEERGHDLTYATSLDLHEGRLDPRLYTAIVFTGHDEYWSKAMRDAAEKAVEVGTHLAFLASNNIYFHIRLEAGNRRIACYKDPGTDPAPDAAGQTVRWRRLAKGLRKAEQRLLGVQYNGMLAAPAPMVVREAGHWFWAGTGLRDGDEIPGLVGVEADGVDPKSPSPKKSEQTLLSASPYDDSLGRGVRTQNTSLCVDGRKTMVFVAGTFHWPLALVPGEHSNEHVRVATGNLIDRMLAPRS
ncbi:N,N-dimethylformamidase beta subunit family domain-containing protein [Phytomonospora sp. NPDC050363]|uniref:N,N-dimethylformamidase beta subunit family domain-containing protein n=1 Tax=Phytomonospora sp. NPDC050363 TaxID=3155642 RepID=UPI0033D47068